jgi:hypothetical protein
LLGVGFTATIEMIHEFLERELRGRRQAIDRRMARTRPSRSRRTSHMIRKRTGSEQSASRRHAQRGAKTAKAVCERLGCSRIELDRWAVDGRMPPDGEIVLIGLPKNINARAWLPATVETAATLIDDWRAQDQARKTFKRRGLRLAQ